MTVVVSQLHFRTDQKRMRVLAMTGALLVIAGASAADAQSLRWTASFAATSSAKSPDWRLDFTKAPVDEPQGDARSAVRAALRAVDSVAQVVEFQDTPEQPLHAAAVEHSDAYLARARIHKVASFATLPLFATELVLAQSLYNTPSNAGALRSAHIIVGTGMIGLFGVNTVTGAWNLFGEGLHEKDGRTLRLVHGMLMMAADVGFVATVATGPNSRSARQALTFESRKATHRNYAVFSIGSGTIGYLIMLLGNH
jgi:hypothetical protein